jgi:hypothetical protein
MQSIKRGMREKLAVAMCAAPPMFVFVMVINTVMYFDIYILAVPGHTLLWPFPVTD